MEDYKPIANKQQADRGSTSLGRFAPGDTVEVNIDTDGAAGNIGTVRSVSKYGRCIVDFPDGSFRSIPNSSLRQL